MEAQCPRVILCARRARTKVHWTLKGGFAVSLASISIQIAGRTTRNFAILYYGHRSHNVPRESQSVGGDVYVDELHSNG